MRFKHGVIIVAGLAAVAATVYISGASAIVSHANPVRFEPSHTSPVAGRPFVGLVIMDTSNSTTPDGFTVTCDAGVVGAHVVWAHQSKFVPPGLPPSQPDLIVCSWQIPPGTAGRVFTVYGPVARFSNGGYAQSSAFHWRVRHR
jgi:hypothetical protein